MTPRLRTAALVVGTGVALAAVVRRLRARPQHGPGTRPAVEVAHPPRAMIRMSNPVVRWMLASPRRMGGAGDALLVLHVTGRRTGAVYDVPVGYHPVGDGRLAVVTDSPWRLNLRGRPEVEVTLKGVRRAARAELVEDPDTVAEVYEALLDEEAPRASARRLGLRLAEERVPGHEELAGLARREHLSVVYLDVDEAYPLSA
ncbi:nitroreductase/quinone reductase family protein [Actinotalea sp. Marseille-Q4924]|uniref:nitroreductase/quinone reductase family protein n=1 Tax=Actinotalea sp. Marseille-Q4924 TaxID=2866571 RepID=UPI001CE3DD67|nr:nitroreductase/quinone reductase family protein [Actinotalea sp. Marseille-Q4924]